MAAHTERTKAEQVPAKRQSGIFTHPYLPDEQDELSLIDYPMGETGPDESIYTATIGAASGRKSTAMSLLAWLKGSSG